MSEIPLWGFELPANQCVYMGEEGEMGGGMHFNAFSKNEVRCMNVEPTLQLKSCDKNNALKFTSIQKLK
jgi:hypothetical protein